MMHAVVRYCDAGMLIFDPGFKANNLGLGIVWP